MLLSYGFDHTLLWLLPITVFIAVNNNNVDMTNVIVGVGVSGSCNRILNTLLHIFHVT